MSVKVRLFGLDENQTKIALANLIQSVPELSVANELQLVLEGKTREISEETKKVLLTNKDAILNMVKNIEAMEGE